MKRSNRYELAKTVRQADAEGLSYGEYVAKQYSEYNLRAKRKPAPLNCMSINDRIKHGIGFPIYGGKTTLQAAAWFDFERSLKMQRKGGQK